jgi:hypothetical protein
MKYTVLWTPAAEERLANIWMSAPNRKAVLDATNEIDLQLKSNPLAYGESRTANSRVGFVYPLGIDFEVIVDDRIVFVWAVWRIDHK